jgi:hypothetical protein
MVPDASTARINQRPSDSRRRQKMPLTLGRLSADHPGLSGLGFCESGYRVEPALAALRQYLLEWIFMERSTPK